MCIRDSIGIRALAVATIGVGAYAFAVVTRHQWGETARWSSQTFAVVWACVVLTAAFPFTLGTAFALLALRAVQAGRRWLFAALLVLTVTASPVAFLLLCVVLVSVALDRRQGMRLARPAAFVLIVAFLELLLWRAFPAGGRYPFSLADAAAACTFCLIGMAVTWRVEPARLLRHLFMMYLVACVAIFLIPTSVGENIARLRFVAIPLAVLTLSLRAWRPRPLALLVLALAVSWNVSPLAWSMANSSADPASEGDYWRPAITFLKAHLTPSYRVEAVDTVDHWPAAHLARAGIPLARGWFRQDDFPENEVLYGQLGGREYLRWLRGLGVRYVVASDAPADYSARGELRLIQTGRSRLRRVFRSRHVAVYVVPAPSPIVVGSGRARVVALKSSTLVLVLDRPGAYRVALHYSPYWHASAGCVARLHDGMMRLDVPRAGLIELRFAVDAERALHAVAGAAGPTCAH